MKPVQSLMKGNLGKVLGVVLLLSVIWHVMVGTTSKVRIAGIFLSRPDEGYTWEGTEDKDTRFFWNSLDVRWQAGTAHTEFQAQTTKEEGGWEPLPGYKFVDRAQGLKTVWEAGLLHPDFQAWSDTGEGLWIPATGYKFVYEKDEFVATVWDPGKRYEDLKIISREEQDSFVPFQGYQFVNPGKTFEVVWTAGLVNTDNPKLISGVREGSWEVNYRPYSRNDDWLGREIAKRIIYHAF